jgi:heme/copper-type cytochrome/quinol oxidase subunit 2
VARRKRVLQLGLGHSSLKGSDVIKFQTGRKCDVFNLVWATISVFIMYTVVFFYMLVSHHQNAGQNPDIKVANRSFENVLHLTWYCIVLYCIYCIQIDPVTGEKQAHRPWI